MSSLLYPLPKSYPVTRGFGDTSITSVGSFGGIGAHTGVDLGAPCGTPILAAANGVVSKVITGAAALANLGGREIHITHSDNLVTIYAHASAVDVKQGQTVAGGQRIGAVGASGAATGCHLHFEVRVGGHPVDPGPLIGIGATAKGGSSSPSKTTQTALAGVATNATLAASQPTEVPYKNGCPSGYLPVQVTLEAPPGGSFGGLDRIVTRVGQPGETGSGFTSCVLASANPVVGQKVPAKPILDVPGIVGSVITGALLEPILNLAALAVGVVFVYAGIRQALSGTK